MLTPKGCHVRWVALDGAGKAEVRLDCPQGYQNNYSSRVVKAREVSFRGACVGGKARVDFVLSPAHATCKKSGTTISCTLSGDTSSASLRGARHRRRRR